MKLIKCHINNFGCLSDVDLQFNEGVNVINRKNGWGKSTLIAFIRVMLFGFDNENARDTDKNERKYFKPWNKADNYGGSLEVEADGRIYRLTAVFGKKQAEDTRQVIDTVTGLPYELYGKSFGETFFLINAKSFERTVYLAHNDRSDEVTDDVRAKMGNVEGVRDDINNSDKAIEALDTAIKAIESGRSKGRLNEIAGRISDLERICNEKEPLSKSLDIITEKYELVRENGRKLTEKISETVSRISAESELQNMYARKDRYFDLIRAVTQREEKLSDLKLAFPNGVPKKSDISSYQEEYASCMELKGRMDYLRLSDEENDTLIKLTEVFSDSVPTDEHFELLKRNIKEISDLDKKIESNRQTYSGRERLEELNARYNGNIPEPGVIDRYIDMSSAGTDYAQQLKMTDSEYSLRQEALNKEIDKAIAENKNKRRLYGTICVLCFLAGIGVLIFLGPIGIPILSIGLLFSLLCGTVRDREIKDPALEELSSKRDAISEKAGAIDDELRSFMESTGRRYNRSQATYMLLNMRNDADEYRRLAEKISHDDTPALLEKREGISENICNMISPYGYSISPDASSSDMTDIYNDLYGKVKTYESLSERHSEYTKVNTKYRQTILGTENFLRSGGYSTDNPSESLKDMAEKLSGYENAKEELDKALAARKAFEEEYPEYESLMAIEKPAESVSVTELDAMRLGLEEELSINKRNEEDYRRQIEEKEKRLEEIEISVSEMADLTAERDTLKAKKALYLKTKECITGAKQNFIGKYIGPVQSAFRKYIKTLTDEDPDNYNIDMNMNLTKEDGGSRKTKVFFSDGQQDAMGICMRMSMIDAMYKAEKPFIIMDDPLNNLDDYSLKQGLDMIEKLSEEYQIVYITCTEKRDFIDGKHDTVIRGK